MPDQKDHPGRSSTKPLSQRVVEDYLSSGEFQVGDKLPSIPDMARRYRVSPPTMGKALGILQVQGYLEGRRGSGVYILRLPGEAAAQEGVDRFSIGLIASTVHASSPILQGVIRAAGRMELNLQIASAEWDYQQERQHLARMIERGLDGVLLHPVLSSRDERNDYLFHEFADFPMVLVDTPVPGVDRSRIVFDNWSAGYEITRHLLAHGHRHIAFMHLCTPTPIRSVEDRLAGFLRAMEEAEIPRSDYFVQRYFSPARPVSPTAANVATDIYDQILERNREAIPELLGHAPAPTAIIAPSDRYAHSLKKLLKETGGTLSGEAVIVGFDNSQEPEWEESFLTTRPDFVRMGERAVEMLVELIKKPDSGVKELILPCPVYLPPGASVSRPDASPS
ncbi:MAG TPA: GntR family transcriptional regulator [Chthoniobacteraceae bacterium]|nr:GntR family transcriptional regulator [Chthoniobacteraceae bacterium]